MAQGGTPMPAATEKSVATDPARSAIPSRPRYHFANMDELAKSAHEMLRSSSGSIDIC